MAGVVAVSLVAASCLSQIGNSPGGQAERLSVTPTYAPSASPPPVVLSQMLQPTESASPTQPKPVKQAVNPSEPTWLIITTPHGKVVLQTPIDPLAAPINPDNTWGKMDPLAWNRAVWETQSAKPGYPSPGTSAIYGHKCHHHVCSFDELTKVRKGYLIKLVTLTGVLTYRADGSAQYPKEGEGTLSSKHSVHNELMLVTCAYERGDESLNNLVVTGSLVAATKR